MSYGALAVAGYQGLSTALKADAAQKEQDARARSRRINEALSRAYARLGSSPAMQKSMLMGDTAFSGIEADPKSIEAQRGALDYLTGVRENRGYTAQDRANLSRIKTDQLQTEKSQRGAIMQNAASKGILNSGLSLSAQLNASQNQANRSQQYGLDVAAQGEARALDAALKGGYLGSTMRDQSFKELAQKAAAKDMVDRFNRGILQNQFTNMMNILGSQAGQQNAVGQNLMYGAERDTQHLGDIVSGVGEAGKAIVGAPDVAKYDEKTGAPLYDPQTGRRRDGA